MDRKFLGAVTVGSIMVVVYWKIIIKEGSGSSSRNAIPQHGYADRHAAAVSLTNFSIRRPGQNHTLVYDSDVFERTMPVEPRYGPVNDDIMVDNSVSKKTSYKFSTESVAHY